MRYLGIVTALFLSLLAGYLYLDNRRLDARVVAEVASHQQTKSDYRAAQAEAHALDVQRLLAEERKHEAVNERIRNDYQASLADLHRRAQRLYDHPQGTAVGGSGGNLAVSSPATAAAGAIGSGEEVGLSPSDALIASEQAHQLKGLLDWFSASSKPSEPPPPAR